MAVRRVRRVIRKVEPWTVLKVAMVLNAVFALMLVLGIWVAWSLAVQRGIPDEVSDMLAQLTIAFTADGELYFRVVVFSAVTWWVLATAALTVGAILYNLISDVVGGVEFLVLEETHAPTGATATRIRPVSVRPENGAPTQAPGANGGTAPQPAVVSPPDV